MTPEMMEDIRAWRMLGRKISDWKEKEFPTYPSKTMVQVNTPRYHGEGVAVMHDDVPVDHIAVLLPNGNVWYYPVEDCRPI